MSGTLYYTSWASTAFILLSFLGLYWSLTSFPRKKMHLGLLLALCVLCIHGIYLLWVTGQLTWINVGKFLFAGLACGSAFVMLAAHDALYAALSFAVSLIAVSGLFLVYGAEFLMAATIIVYTGAIVVTFLFVIMLARQAGHLGYDSFPREPLLACFGGFILSATIGMLVMEVMLKDDLTYRMPGQRALAEHGSEEQQLRELATQALGSLRAIKDAVRANMPREEIVRLVVNKTVDDVGFMDRMDKLARQEWKENKVLEAKQEKIRERYNSLLSSLAAEPLDYEKCFQLIVNLENAIADFVDIVSGHYPITRIEDRPSMRGVGLALFGYYSVPIQLAGWLLLIVTVGTYLISARYQQATDGKG